MVPTPGPYSTIVRARFQSTRLSRRSMRKPELGINEPSLLGCWIKFFANNSVSSLREGLDSMLVIKSFEKRGSIGELNILASSLRCKAKGDGGIGKRHYSRKLSFSAAYPFSKRKLDEFSQCPAAHSGIKS